MMFASPPAVTTVDARGLSLPCSTTEWNGPFNEIAWMPPKLFLYEDAMVALWSGKPLLCNSFGVRILATSVLLEIWQAQHGHGSWLPENWKERHYTVAAHLLRSIEGKWSTCSREEVSQTSHPHHDPLAWNSIHVLYGCTARLGTDTAFVEEGLCNSTASAVRQGIRLMYSQLDVSKVDTRAILTSLEGYEEVVRGGIKLASQTACWERGVEHALAGMHCATILVNWVRHVEEKEGTATVQEKQLLNRLRAVMEEGDVNIYQESLAASFLRSCIQLMEEVWIWGITPVMGEAFRLYTEEILGSRGAIMEVEPILLEDEQKSEYGDSIY